jgi:hypothetical protein
MPVTTPDIKVNNVRRLGGTVELVGETYQEAQAHALKVQEGETEARQLAGALVLSRLRAWLAVWLLTSPDLPAQPPPPSQRAVAEGLTFVAPYDDPYTIAGQGTIGDEILRQVGGPQQGEGRGGGRAQAASFSTPRPSHPISLYPRVCPTRSATPPSWTPSLSPSAAAASSLALQPMSRRCSPTSRCGPGGGARGWGAGRSRMQRSGASRLQARRAPPAHLLPAAYLPPLTDHRRGAHRRQRDGDVAGQGRARDAGQGRRLR